MSELTRERALAYFGYNPETGDLRELERPEHEFVAPHRYARHVKRIGAVAGSRDDQGYWRVSIDGQKYRAHRLIWFMTHGEWPPAGFVIDHINGTRTDNRLSNLRLVPCSENTKNSKIGIYNKSGVIGVAWHKSGKWVARIKANGRTWQRSFSTFEEACAARLKWSADAGFHPNHGRPAPCT